MNDTVQANMIQKIPLLKVGDKVKFGLYESMSVNSLEVGKIIRVPTPSSNFYIIEKDKTETQVLGKNIFYKLLFERKIKRVNIQNYTKKDKQMQKKLYGHLLNDKVVTHDVQEKYMDIKFHLQDDYDTREDYMVKVGQNKFIALDDVIAFYRPYYGTVNKYLEDNLVSVCYDEGEFGIGNICKTISIEYVLQDDREGRTIDHLELSKITELLDKDIVKPLQDGEDTLLVALPRYNRNLSGNVVQCYRVGQLRRAVKYLNNGKELMIGPDVQIYQREKVINNYETFRQVYEGYRPSLYSNIDEYKNLFQFYTKLNTIKNRVEKMLQRRLEKRQERMEEVKKITLTNLQSIPKMVWVGDGKFTGRSNCIYHWQYTTKKFMLPEGDEEFKASFYKLIETEATTNQGLVGAYNRIEYLIYEIFTVLQPDDHENDVNNLILKINKFVREFNRRYKY